MNSFLVICGLVVSVVIQSTQCVESDQQQVTDYLIKNGYLETPYTNHSLRRSLRQFQRENGLTINGRITDQTIEFIQTENDKQMVLDYLKIFGYLQGTVSPSKITDALKRLQQNSGVLTITGSIDIPTIEFIKTHPRGYSEGLYA